MTRRPGDGENARKPLSERLSDAFVIGVMALIGVIGLYFAWLLVFASH